MTSDATTESDASARALLSPFGRGLFREMTGSIVAILGAVLIGAAVLVHGLFETNVQQDRFREQLAMASGHSIDEQPLSLFLVDAYLVLLRLANADDADDVAALRAQFDQLGRKFDDARYLWELDKLPPVARAHLNQNLVPPSRRFFDLAVNRFLPAQATGDRALARRALGDIGRAYHEHQAALVGLNTLLLGIAVESGDALFNRAMGRVAGALALLGLAVVGALFAGAVLFRRIALPLAKLAEATRAVAAGKLDADIPVFARRDEISEMAEALRVFRDALAKVDQLAAERVIEHARLQDAIEALPMGLSIYDGNMELVVSNTRAAELMPPSARPVFKKGTRRTDIARAVYTAPEWRHGLSQDEIDARLARVFDVDNVALARAPIRTFDDHMIVPVRARTREGGLVDLIVDVTELWQSQQLLRQLVETMPVAVVMYGPDKTVRVWNQLFVDFLPPSARHTVAQGAKLEDLLRAFWSAPEYRHGLSPVEVEKRIGRRLAEAGPRPVIRDEFETWDGRQLQFFDFGTGDGHTVRIYQDVTAIRKSEQRIRSILDAIPFGVIVYDRDMKVTVANRNIHQIIPSLTPESIEGTPREDVARRLVRQFAGHQDLPPEIFDERVRNWMGLNRSSDLDTEVEFADGRHILVRSKRLDDGSMIFVDIDVTATKRAEQRLRDAIDSLPVGIGLFDSEGRLEMWNQNLLDFLPPSVRPVMTDKRPLDETIRAIWNSPELKGTRSAEEIEDAIRRARDEVETGNIPVIEYKSWDGRAYLRSGARMKDGGSIRAYQDVTAIRRSEQVLREAIDNMPVGVAMLDSEGRLQIWNQHFLDFMPPSVHDVIVGRHALDTTIRAIWNSEEMKGKKTPDEIEDMVRRAREEAASGNIPLVEFASWDGRIYLRGGAKMKHGGTIRTFQDITAIKRSEQLLSDAIDKMPLSVAIYDSESRLRIWNTPFVETLPPSVKDRIGVGTPRETVLRAIWRAPEFVHGRTPEAIEEFIRGRIAADESLSMERLEYVAWDKRIFQFLSARLSDGGTIRIHQDVTAIRRSEERIRNILDAVPVGVIVYDSDRRVITCNRALRQIIPTLPQGNFVGLSRRDVTRDFVRLIAGNRGLSGDALDRAVETWMEESVPAGAEVETRFEDGRVILSRSEGLDDGALIIVDVDVTRVHQAEMRLKTVIDTLEDAVLLFDGQGRLALKNRQVSALLPELDRRAEAGQSAKSIIDALRGRGFKIPAELLKPGSINESFHHQLAIGDRWYLLRRVGMSDDGTLVSVTDMTNIRNTQEALASSERMAALGGLVAGVAHEVNTPIGVGVTAASFLKEKVGMLERNYKGGMLAKSDFEQFIADANESTDILYKNLDRAAELVASFKRISIDQTHDDKRNLDLGDYFRDIATSLSHEIKRTPHALKIDCPPGLKLETWPGAIAQIVTNFVMNSLNHAFEPGVAGTMTLSAKVEGKRVHIDYADDGKGVSAEDLKKLFVPFFTTARAKGGSGLGLSVVERLVVDRLGGSIVAKSRPGQGLRFAIVLPVT